MSRVHRSPQKTARSPHSQTTGTRLARRPSEDPSKTPDPTPPPPRAAKKQQQDPQEAFTAFYLRQVTSELAEDLDKIRSAADFNDRSLPLLVEALKQGVKTFGVEERLRIGRAAAGGM
ncbi:hypothetical protein LTR66_007257 [Elasticomyces elasticus]|nr:hypothetical protein LTR66_007257 [Elasticomyces elasticus]